MALEIKSKAGSIIWSDLPIDLGKKSSLALDSKLKCCWYHESHLLSLLKKQIGAFVSDMVQPVTIDITLLTNTFQAPRKYLSPSLVLCPQKQDGHILLLWTLRRSWILPLLAAETDTAHTLRWHICWAWKIQRTLSVC